MGAKRGPVRLDDQQTAAEALAIAALTFLAGEPERLGRFLALTGIGPEKIRAAAAEPGFLAGILEHIGSDQSLLLAFANQSGVEPKHIEAARGILSGHWERDVP